MESRKLYDWFTYRSFLHRSILNNSFVPLLGALLDQDTEDAKFAFEYAVDYVNYQYGTDMLEAEVEVVEPDDEFACAQKLCEILEVSYGCCLIIGFYRCSL